MREANVPSVPKCDKQIQVTGKSQHARYGTIRYAAFRENSPNVQIQQYTSPHRKISQRNAKPYHPAPKKKNGHRKFTASWIPYKVRALFLALLLGLDAIKNEAIPIMIKRIVHTTGNSHPGGDKGGLFNVANTFIPFLVKKPETAPVARGTAMQVISFLVSFFKNIPLSGLRRSADSIHFLCLLYFRMPVSIQS